MHALRQRASVGYAAAVFGWFSLLTVILVVLRDAPQLGAVIVALALSLMAFGLGQFVMLVRFKWRLEDLAPDVVSQRHIGSLMWGLNSYRVIGATQDERVRDHSELAPTAIVLAGLELGAFAWYASVAVLTLGLSAAVALRSGNAGALLFLAFFAVAAGAIAVPAYIAYRGR